ncbi:MAG: PQQ-binding-like beta-propeller repeat protein [Planctomycetota bacterium]
MMRRRLMRCGACLMVFVVLCGTTDGQEWTRFRGPDGTGIGKGESIPVSFTEADYLWKAKLPGPGHSSPVLWGHRIFLTCTHDAQEQREVVCLDARSGKMLWSTQMAFTPYKHNSRNSFAASTPAVDAERVYINWISGGTFVALALDHAGKKLWRREVGDFQARHGAGASPIALNGHMIVANDNKQNSFLAALDGRTGETAWRIERSSKMTSYITPAVYRPKNGDPEVIFVSEAHGITGVDPASGQKKWESDKLFTLKSVCSPVAAGGVIFATAGSGGRGRESAAVRPGNKLTGHKAMVAWKLDSDLPYVCTPIAIGEHLYILSDSGVMTCVIAAMGEKIWQEDLDRNFYASPVCVNGRIYLLSRDGEVIVLEAGSECTILARSTLPEKTDATPAIANGRMYIRTLNHLICIGDSKAEN